jgi:hypothetical protein
MEARMGRRTQVLGFSVSPEVAKDYARMTAEEGTTKSELFRRMVTAYKAKQEEEEFFRLQRRMAGRQRRRRPLTEKEIDRIVFEDR